MKKPFIILLILLFSFSCAAEAPVEPPAPPTDMELAESALPLLTALMSSPAFTSFEEEVPFDLWRFVYTTLELPPETPLFILPPAEGAEDGEQGAPLARAVEIEDAYDVGGGEVKVTLVVYLDGEFEMYCDVYLVYMQDSLYTGVISRAFIAE